MLGHIIATAFHAVFPIVGLILLGYILKRIGFLGEAFIKNGSKLVFHVALPCMLFVNVYDIGALGDVPWSFVAYCALVICLLFCVGFVMAMAGTKVPERRGVIWQCAFRSNFAIIGMPLAAALGGAEAEAVAAIVSALAIPMFNIMAVVALSVFVSGNDRQRPPGQTEEEKRPLLCQSNPNEWYLWDIVFQKSFNPPSIPKYWFHRSGKRLPVRADRR